MPVDCTLTSHRMKSSRNRWMICSESWRRRQGSWTKQSESIKKDYAKGVLVWAVLKEHCGPHPLNGVGGASELRTARVNPPSKFA